MKRKHYGLFSVAIIGVSILLLSGYGMYLTGNIKSNVKIARPGPLPHVEIPDDATLKKMEKLNRRLISISRMTDDSTPFSMRIFGWEPVLMASNKKSISDTEFNEEHVDFSYDLTLCFSSKKNSFCVIDKGLFTLGSLLPDHGKIIKIDHDRVQIKKNDVKKWIYLSRKNENNMPVKEKS
ncbi:MAG: hypothetical protein GY699_26885 [Desulfobacteraceae bacterium]|nr:hypothetical protein [Desulfobacteraceae bacterium]